MTPAFGYAKLLRGALDGEWALINACALDDSWTQQPCIPVNAADRRAGGVRKALAEATH